MLVVDEPALSNRPRHLVLRNNRELLLQTRPTVAQMVHHSKICTTAVLLSPPFLVTDVLPVSPRAARLSQMKRACLGSRLVVAACQMVAGAAVSVDAAASGRGRPLAAGEADVAMISLSLIPSPVTLTSGPKAT